VATATLPCFAQRGQGNPSQSHTTRGRGSKAFGLQVGEGFTQPKRQYMGLPRTEGKAEFCG
jgi:hypothetical protein